RPQLESEALALKLFETGWCQRLRDVSQTANTRLVYMFSEHSRFGHSVGVAFLANMLMDRLAVNFPEDIARYRTAVSAAAVLHDVGHLAPGSHTACKTWFPTAADAHEQIGIKIIAEDSELVGLLNNYGEDLVDDVCAILSEAPHLPPWTWEIISGGGWNVDRGNWCIVDSILAGVNYGKYNIPALIESMQLSSDKHLTLRENRLDAMMHFALSRHAMYRQIYQHRVLLAADTLNQAIAQRARDLGPQTVFADQAMQYVLAAETPEALELETIFAMRESWWRYHLAQWSVASDAVLRDLSTRLLNRKLFKTVRIRKVDDADKLRAEAREAVIQAGFDPRYYLQEVSTVYMHKNDSRQSLLVSLDDGSVLTMGAAEPLYDAITKESSESIKAWLVMPAEAKLILGRER
ncbi:HD domain-containing protein, partial [Oligoflexia bacterium]|nr:HD domain-containing protein [Oligoflexia bacterium]